MKQSKKSLILSILFPIIILLSLTLYKRSILLSTNTMILPIVGYDPRDLLAGQYLTYQVVYDVVGVCVGNTEDVTAFICLKPKQFSYQKPYECKALIEGRCKNNNFVAGIERFYIPQEKASYLDSKIREKLASIEISLTESGATQVKQLLIDGKPWNE